MIIAGLIVFSARMPSAQIQIVCFTCSLQIIYVGYATPYIEPWMNKLELCNEYLVLVQTYFLFIYSDGLLNVPSPLYPEVPELVKDEETL